MVNKINNNIASFTDVIYQFKELYYDLSILESFQLSNMKLIKRQQHPRLYFEIFKLQW